MRFNINYYINLKLLSLKRLKKLELLELELLELYSNIRLIRDIYLYIAIS